jgi:hypothetical protein
MKHVLIAAFITACLVAPAFAGGGWVGVYEDQAGLDCNIVDTGAPRAVTLWVVHTDPDGATGIQFRATKPGCLPGWVFLADQLPCCYVAPFGNSQTGIAVGYQACLSGAIVVLGMQFFITGGVPPCCYYGIYADPNSGSSDIESVECDGSTVVPVIGHSATINGYDICECGLAAEPATWGAIKALYE